ncbi:hypothetical protein MTP99_009149, partial [Tenebrio molitor]
GGGHFGCPPERSDEGTGPKPSGLRGGGLTALRLRGGGGDSPKQDTNSSSGRGGGKALAFAIIQEKIKVLQGNLNRSKNVHDVLQQLRLRGGADQQPPRTTAQGGRNNFRVLQLNTNRSRVVHELLDQLMRERGASILLISEPNTRLLRAPGWLKDDLEDVAIMLRGVQMRKWGKGRGFVWVEVTSYVVFSCYISPNITAEEYERQLDDLANCVRMRGASVVVTGDFNAKAFMWGSEVEDARGRKLADWAAGMNLVAMNEGEPTFERG